MQTKKLSSLIVSILLFSTEINAQPWMHPPYFKINSPSDSSKFFNFYEIQKAFALYEKRFERKHGKELNDMDGDEGKFPGYSQFKRWEWFMQSRVYPSGDISLPSTNWDEFQKYLNTSSYKNGNSSTVNFSGNWSPLGPTGTHWHGYFGGAGRVSFLRFDPTNSNTMWTFAPSGGLWKTIDGGLNWTTNTDQLPIIGCSDLAINPVNSQIMYLATGDGNGTGSQLWLSSIGILKSTDGGLTWPANSTNLNWQVSWSRSIYKLLINPNNPNIVFSATSNGLYRSTDGTNFFQVQAGIFTDVEFKPGNPNIVYATSGVNNTGTFYKSIDGGATFIPITSGLPLSANVGRLEIGVTPADSNYVYVVAVKKVTNDFYGFYRSTDGGDNFSLMSNTPNILSGLPGSQAWYNLAMAVSPFHKDTVIVGATESYRSTNGGVTWTKHTSTTGAGAPFIHPDFHDIEYLPGNDSTYFGCNDGGVWKTTDYGTTWNPMNEGLQIGQIYKLGTNRQNQSTILTGHQDMATHRLTNNVWDIVTPNTGDGMECIYEYDNDTIMYLESYNGRIIKTINTFPLFNVVCTFSGAGVNAAGNWITPVIMHPVYDTILLVGKAQVWRSTTAGAGFVQVGNIPASGGNLCALAYAPSATNFIYAAKTTKFFAATDGNNFVDRTAGLPVASASITSIAVSNTDSGKVWVTFSGYSAANKVWFSPDSGVTWFNKSAGLPNLPVNCIVYQNNTNNALYVGTDVGVYFICDTLASWQPFFTGLPNVDVQELEIAYSINKLRAATNGRGLWETDLAIVTGISLPVDLLRFNGKKVNTDVILEWTTASEKHNDHFEIEYSADGKAFNKIGSVKGHNNSNSNQNYLFVDEESCTQGLRYYCLKQFDVNGSYAYSNIIDIDCNSDKPVIQNIFPNPVKNEINYSVYSPFNCVIELEIVTTGGKIILSEKKISLLAGVNVLHTNIKSIANGTYFLVIKYNPQNQVQMKFEKL